MRRGPALGVVASRSHGQAREHRCARRLFRMEPADTSQQQPGLGWAAAQECAVGESHDRAEARLGRLIVPDHLQQTL
jgi:hypothetical protein